MMQDKAIHTLGKLSIGLIVGMFAACAGSDTPPRTDDFDDKLAIRYPLGSETGVAGSSATPSGGTGGRAPTGTGGTASGTGGAGTGGTASPGTGGSATAGEAGAGSSAAGSAGMADPGACDGFAILKTSCGSAGCHGAGSGYSAFAAVEGNATDFVDTDAVGPSCNGDGPIFDPANPPASLIIQKINGTACGSQMPIGASAPFPPADLTCIQDWISNLE
jgi:hypothetical protein